MNKIKGKISYIREYAVEALSFFSESNKLITFIIFIVVSLIGRKISQSVDYETQNQVFIVFFQ